MKKLIFILGVALYLTGCNGGKGQTNIELNQNMMDQVAIKSQGWNHVDDTVQMRVPPVGTVARGHAPYKFAKDPAGAEKDVNPLAGNMSPEVLEVGRAKYDIYCALCHGPTGHNDGTITPHMPVKPRVLASDEARAYSDGRIYFAITAGRGVMGSYAGQIPEKQGVDCAKEPQYCARWAVVNYVRSIQKK